MKYKMERSKGRSSKSNRSDSMNLNNPEYWASVLNRSNQLNPNNPEHKGGKKK